MLLTTGAECISGYRECRAGKHQFVTKRRQDSWASEEPTFLGCSLASVWHSHCTSSTVSNEMKMDNLCGDSIVSAQLQFGGAVQGLNTENTPIRPLVAHLWGWINIRTFFFFCSFALLLCPNKRRCKVDRESQDQFLGAFHNNGCIPRTLVYCVLPSWDTLTQRRTKEQRQLLISTNKNVKIWEICCFTTENEVK